MNNRGDSALICGHPLPSDKSAVQTEGGCTIVVIRQCFLHVQCKKGEESHCASSGVTPILKNTVIFIGGLAEAKIQKRRGWETIGRL